MALSFFDKERSLKSISKNRVLITRNKLNIECLTKKRTENSPFSKERVGTEPTYTSFTKRDEHCSTPVMPMGQRTKFSLNFIHSKRPRGVDLDSLRRNICSFKKASAGEQDRLYESQVGWSEGR